jgi:hypothetical protein
MSAFFLFFRRDLQLFRSFFRLNDNESLKNKNYEAKNDDFDGTGGPRRACRQLRLES